MGRKSRSKAIRTNVRLVDDQLRLPLVGFVARTRAVLDETLTVLKLGVGPTLRKSLATTNPIESTFSTVRWVSRRVKRWPTGTMALRWALAGVWRRSVRGDGSWARRTCRSS